MHDYLPAAVGDRKFYKGYITEARFLRMQSAAEVELRVGYRAGRLRDGYWLVFLIAMPRPADFEYRGYSQMSGGIARGHLPQHANDPNAEQRLIAKGANLTGTSYQRMGMKQKTIRDTFALSGARRLAKILPIAEARNDPGVPAYPPGTGIPQWELMRKMPFVAAAFVGPGERYEGMYK